MLMQLVSLICVQRKECKRAVEEKRAAALLGYAGAGAGCDPAPEFQVGFSLRIDKQLL